MPTFPTTEALTTMFLTNLESQLNEDAPLNDKAFLRALASSEAMLAQSIYKAAVVEAKQTLATTAYRDGLIEIGDNYEVPVKPAEAVRMKLRQLSTTTTTIPVNVVYVGDLNGAEYRSVSSEYDPGVPAVYVTVDAIIPGGTANMEVGQTLTMTENIPGVDSQTAVVDEIIDPGVDDEDTEDYRIRVLDEQRTPGGGGNAADHRKWAQSVAGCDRAYPYAGINGSGIGVGYRVVFIKADEDISDIGIAPQWLLDDCRTAILETEDGFDQSTLGIPPTGLDVLSITTQNIYVTVKNISISDPSKLDDLKARINENLGIYFKSREPFITGLDVISEKRDTLTRLSVSEAVQDALKEFGAWATDVFFGVTSGSSLDSYILGTGELPVLAEVGYV
jgi:hypothetical protein